MSSKDSKRSKNRKKLSNSSKSYFPNEKTSIVVNEGGNTNKNSTTHFQAYEDTSGNLYSLETDFSINVKDPSNDAERITELMDAPVEDYPHSINKGPNPYLDRCVYCKTPRTECQDDGEGTELLDLRLDDNTVIALTTPQSFKLEIWTCPKCRKDFPSFLESNKESPTYDGSMFQDKSYVDPCEEWEEERVALDKEQHVPEEHWVTLIKLVKDLYTRDEEPYLSELDESKLEFYIEALSLQDPHQLFVRLESQVREMVSDMKNVLLQKLKENGFNNPESALDFTSTMLSFYEKLTCRAHILAQYMGCLTDHFKQFKVTWELLNKHLFHSIAHNESTISNSGPTILEQLRQGSLQHEKTKTDPYCSVRKKLLKFQEEMSVVAVVWRDCKQLIQNYCQEEVKNTQKQVSSKAKDFISQQRQLLKEHLKKGPVMDEAFAETIRNLMSDHKSSTKRVLCQICHRERCNCDECTITHMITCGIITEKDIAPPNSFSFPLDDARDVLNFRPPSMSSTTSSSGSVSPINMEDKITAFYDCGEDFSDEILEANGVSDHPAPLFNGHVDDIDENAGDDEDEDDDGDFDDAEARENENVEPHTVSLSPWEMKALQMAVHNCNTCPLACDENSICAFQPRTPGAWLKLNQFLESSTFSAGPETEYMVNGLSTSNETTPSAESGNQFSQSVCAPCQCHACLKQSGHTISTSLPLQVPVSPPPAELHLYPHIHGLPQHNSQRYMLNLPGNRLPPPLKDFEDPDNHFHTHSEWDPTLQPRAGSLAAQHRLSGLNSELLPTIPIAGITATPTPFNFESLSLSSHLATHTTQTSTTNTTSAFKAVTGKNIASTLIPNINNFSVLTEGSSVDPAAKPLEFQASLKNGQHCLKTSLSTPVSFTSAVSTSISTATSFSSVPSSLPASSPVKFSAVSCHSPTCSRPAPVGGNSSSSKWEKNHSLCKKGASNLGLLNKNSHHAQAIHNFTENQPPLNPISNPFKAHRQPHRDDANSKNMLNPLSCSHPSSASLQQNSSSSNILSPPCSQSVNQVISSSALPLAETAVCNDPECDAHHEDNCDSVDDSCSEKSSSTSTSNQKEGKYCDCCYCEFFGHSNTQTSKTSNNYAEIKDRLQKKLKKKKDQQTERVENVCESNRQDEPKDLLEKKGLEGLLSFINGTDQDAEKRRENKEQTAKAAKRARQKQRKLEERARQVKTNTKNTYKQTLHHNQMQNNPLHEALLIQSESNSQSDMGKPQARKPVQDENDKQRRTLRIVDLRLKQEASRSLIIESTRPTISFPERPTPTKEPPKKLLDLICFQSLKNQRQQNQSTTKTPVVRTDTIQNGTIQTNGSVPKVPKSSKNKEKSSSPNNHLLKYQQLQQSSITAAEPTKQSQGKMQNLTKTKQKSQQQKNLTTPQQNEMRKPDEIRKNVKKVETSVQTSSTISQPLANGKILTRDKIFEKPVVNGNISTKVNSNYSSSGKPSVAESPSAGSGSSASQSPSCGQKPPEQAKVKSKKNKKKGKNGDITNFDEIFMPKPEAELVGDVDEVERELEEFKRFCFEQGEPKQKRKLAVNVNLKDLFKKKPGLVSSKS